MRVFVCPAIANDRQVAKVDINLQGNVVADTRCGASVRPTSYHHPTAGWPRRLFQHSPFFLSILPMKTVLVIEDNLAIRENTVELLELLGFQVASAPDGPTGLQLIQEIRPDSILCDILMPGMDGYAVLRELRSQRYDQTASFYFMSAQAEMSDRQKGIALGATGYLIKPFTEKELLACFN